MNVSRFKSAVILGAILLAVAAAWWLMLGSEQLSRTSYIRIGVEENYPPFSYIEDGRQMGFDVDIGRAVCKAMNLNCEIVPLQFDHLIPDLLEQRIDLIIAGLGATQERRKQLLFSETYYRSRSFFISRNMRATGITAENASGLVIGVQKGSLQAQTLRRRFVPHGALLNEYETYAELAEAIKAGKVDALFVDGLSGYALLKQAEGAGLYIGGSDEEFDPDIINAHIAARKQDERLIESINDALERLKADGSYQTISMRYFTFMNY